MIKYIMFDKESKIIDEKTIDFVFNVQSIKNIPLNKFTKDFTFVVNGQKHETSRFIADLLSPKVAQFHFIDESIHEYHLKTEQQGDFEQFIKLVNFEHNFYSETEMIFFYELFIELGNDKYFNLNPNFFEPITINNAVSRIQNKFLFYSKLSKSTKSTNSSVDFRFIQNEISFISTHFYEIINHEEQEKEETERRKYNLISLGIDIIEMILQNKNLRLYDEDSLFNFILLNLESIDEFSLSKSIKLFEYVRFENLSHESIEKFISIFDIEYLNKKIWLSICQRLLLTPNQEYLPRKDKVNDIDIDQNGNRYILKTIPIPFKNTFNEGLFHYLCQKYDFDHVEVTSSSVYSSHIQPKDTVFLFSDNDNVRFRSVNAPNEWICYQFEDFLFKLAKYQIRTFDGGQNCGHLKNWVLEASKDEQLWQEIDRQTNCSLLNGPKKCSTFCTQSPTDFVKFIRLRQIDQNWCGNNYLLFNSIEFYGELLELK
ncbi:hypothetical protein TRFO_16497 [Tritrichomonas foetus]|uniref:F5/8 type C domain-containing protein n=1 Tax=Tritrichomonas foetus TaxID=1144522 RepID=A0A1J4KUF8_9EUKA|nr:hypothetical protein TRFO_16497 [Tritrichomonas foetus]|eukprot:OHT13396.1 hypothetical protein TRFO_16497 [Tritrichomonas foetus]